METILHVKISEDLKSKAKMEALKNKATLTDFVSSAIDFKIDFDKKIKLSKDVMIEYCTDKETKKNDYLDAEIEQQIKFAMGLIDDGFRSIKEPHRVFDAICILDSIHEKLTGKKYFNFK